MIDISTRIAFVDYLTEEELRDVVNSSKTLQEVLRKLGYSSASGSNRQTVQQRINRYGISTAHFTKGVSNGVPRSDEDIFCENSEVTQAVLRRRYIKRNFTPYVCAICGQPPVWNNMPLTLTLDHIDGVNTNNAITNLRWVCPNCDRQLPTFCSKNRQHL